MWGNDAVRPSITLELSVQRLECLRLLVKGCALASQAGSRPVATMGKRGACQSRLNDGISQRKNLQNGFVVHYRGIACLADCYVWLQAITFADGCAYARHTPHALRLTGGIAARVRGGVLGWLCCTWPSVCSLPAATHPFSSGWGCRLAGVSGPVIEQAAGTATPYVASGGGWPPPAA